MSKWVYKLHPLKYGQNPLISEKEINTLALEQGWEVVTVYNNPGAVVMFRKLASGKELKHAEAHGIASESQNETVTSTYQSEESVDEDQNNASEGDQIADEKAKKQEAMTYYRMGSVKLSDGYYEQAIEEYDKALEIDPDFTMALIFKANAHLKLRNWNEAQKDFKKALDLKPNDASCLINLSICYRELSQYEQAIECCDQILKFDSSNLMAYENRGITHRLMKDHEAAIADFNHVISINKDDIEAIMNRAETKMDIKEYDEAISDYDLAIKVDPQNATAYMKRAKAKQLEGDDDGYEEDMKKYKQICTLIMKSRFNESPDSPAQHQESSEYSSEDDEITLVDDSNTKKTE